MMNKKLASMGLAVLLVAAFFSYGVPWSLGELAPQQPAQLVVEEENKFEVNMQKGLKNRLTLLTINNNDKVSVYGVEIKVLDGKITSVKGKGWDRVRVDKSTVLVKTSSGPLESGDSLTLAVADVTGLPIRLGFLDVNNHEIPVKMEIIVDNIIVGNIAIRDGVRTVTGGKPSIEDNVAGAVVKYNTIVKGGGPSTKVGCDVPSGSLVGVNNPPYDDRTAIKCAAIDKGVTTHKPNPVETTFYVEMFRQSDWSRVTYDNENERISRLGLPTWVHGSSFAPIMVTYAVSDGAPLITARTGLVGAQFSTELTAVWATFFDSEYLDPEEDANDITETWTLTGPDGEVSQTSRDVSLTCDDVAIEVATPSRNCNEAKVTVRADTGDGLLVVTYDFTEGIIKESINFDPISTASSHWVSQQFTLDADSIKRGALEPVAASPLNLHDFEFVSTIFLLDNDPVLVSELSSWILLEHDVVTDDLSYDVMADASGDEDMGSPLVDFCLKTSGNGDSIIADFHYGTRESSVENYGTCVGEDDQINLEPFMGEINIDPTISTSNPPSLDGYAIKSSSGTSPWGQNTGLSTINHGDVKNASCSIGTGNCTYRGFIEWTITSMAIPTTAIIDIVYLRYATSSNVVDSPAGSLDTAMIYEWAGAIPPSSADCSAECRYTNVDGNEIYVNPWPHSPNTSYETCPTSCQNLGSGAQADFDAVVGAGGTWFAILLISDDNIFEGSNAYRKTKSAETSASGDKEYLEVHWHT